MLCQVEASWTRSSISKVERCHPPPAGLDQLETMIGGSHNPTLEISVKHPQLQDLDWLKLFSQLGVSKKMGGSPPEKNCQRAAPDLGEWRDGPHSLSWTRVFADMGRSKVGGVPCMANVSVNSRVLIMFCLTTFCPLQSGPKSPNVGFLSLR